MKENMEPIIVMLDELLTIGKCQLTPRTVNANIDITLIQALIEKSNRQEHTATKLMMFTETIAGDLNAINNQIGEIIQREQPDLEEIKKLLVQTARKMDEANIQHNINEVRHSFALETKWDLAIVISIVLLVDSLISALYFVSRPNYKHTDNDLKYRYIKMKGEVMPERMVTLRDILELNGNNGKISQMRKDVKTYEEALWKQTALNEQARLKEQAVKEQENKSQFIKDKQELSKDNPSKKSKP